MLVYDMQSIPLFFYTGNDGSLFTGVNYNLYQAPDGFCFDILCGDEPIIDNVKSKEYNVQQRVIIFHNKNLDRFP